MSFRLRLSLLFVATLVAVQIFTALLIYAVARRALIAEGERQLDGRRRGGRAPARRHLEPRRRQRAGARARLRAALGDRAARSEHRAVGAAQPRPPHRRRTHAADRPRRRDPFRHVESDRRGRPASFRFPDLADAALDRPAAAVVAMDGKAYWMIVVPVYAPEPIALIAAGIPVDNPLLARLQQLSALPNTIELVTDTGGNGTGSTLRAATNRSRSPRALSRAGHALPLTADAGARRRARIRRARDAPARIAAAARRSRPCSAIRSTMRCGPYRSVALAWASLVALGLACGPHRRDADRAQRRASDRDARRDRASRRIRRLHGARAADPRRRRDRPARRRVHDT